MRRAPLLVHGCDPLVRLALALVLLAGITAGMAAQSSRQSVEAPTFRTSTTLVPLDVRVIDRAGRPVTDLTAADFRVTEEGVVQAIQHFSHQVLLPVPVVPTGPLVRARRWTTASLAPQNHRVFLILLGRGDLRGPAEGIDGIVHLVRDRLLPQDRVAIMAWNRSTDFTTDRARSLAVLDRFKRHHRSIETTLRQHVSSLAFFYGQRDIPQDLQRQIDEVFAGPERAPLRSGVAVARGSTEAELRIREDFDAYTAREDDDFADLHRDQLAVDLDTYMKDTAQTMQDEGNLYAGIEYLRHLDGEKHLVWLTEYGLRRSFRSPVESDHELGRRAADARVVVNVIRAGGTETGRTGGVAESTRPAPPNALAAMTLLLPAAASRTLAELTGGRSDANRFPNASVAADHIEAASRSQYLIGYYPTNTVLDGRFRQVKVTVTRPGVSVLVRGGYYARSDDGNLDREGVVTLSRIAAAASDATEVHDLSFSATASLEADASNAVRLTVRLDLSRLTFDQVGNRHLATVEIAAFCLDDRQRPVGELRRRVELNYSGARLVAVRDEGTDVVLSVPVTGPATSMKLVVYDYADDLIGSRNVPVSK